MRAWILAVALFLGACGELEPDPDLLCDGPPGAAEAVEIARQAIGIARTTVWWYGPQALTEECGYDSWMWDGRCVYGVTGSNGSVIGWNGVWKPSETILFHEITHQKYGDPYHSRVDLWGPKDAPTWYTAGTVSGDVHDAIVAAGL